MENINLLFSFLQKSIEEGPLIVKNNVYWEDVELEKRDQFEKIKKILDSFLEGNIDNRFVYMPGLRGVGKTTLVLQLIDYLEKNGINKERILYFSGDNLKQLLGSDISDIVFAFVNRYYGVYKDLDEKVFVFVDEVQEFADWLQQAKNIYHSSENIFLFFTGIIDSAGEINTNEEIFKKTEDLYPLNFGEYLSINYGINFNYKLPLKVVNTIFTGKLYNIGVLERTFYKSIKNRDLFMKKSFEHYLLCGSFPESMNLNVYWGHKLIYDNLIKILEKDLFVKGEFLSDTRIKIYRIVSFIALQRSANFIRGNIAKYVKMSYSQLFKVIDSLENLNLIFHFSPYEGKRGVKRIRNYYFSTPNFHAAINSQVGEFTPNDMSYLEILVKSAVASTLFRMRRTHQNPVEIWVPNGKNQADFLLISDNDSFVPVEVGFGAKPQMNIYNSIDKYDCEYGVVISDSVSSVRKNYNIIHMPLTTFSLI